MTVGPQIKPLPAAPLPGDVIEALFPEVRDLVAQEREGLAEILSAAVDSAKDQTDGAA